MKNEQGTLIFHNRKLIHISNNAFFLFGDNPITLRNKNMSEILFSGSIDLIDSIKNRKSCHFSLSTVTGNILECQVTKSIIEENETICIYIDIEPSIISHQSAILTSGIFQETNKENLTRIFEIIDSIETVRNKKALNVLKELITSNSIDMYEMLTLTKTSADKEFEGSYTIFDLTALLEEIIENIKKKYNKHNVYLIPKINQPFRVSSDKEMFENLIFLIADMLSKSGNELYFIIKADDKKITLAISQYEIPRNLIYNKLKVVSFDSQKVDDVLKLSNIAKKAGAEFSYTKYTDKTELIKISFNATERRQLYQDKKNFNLNKNLKSY